MTGSFSLFLFLRDIFLPLNSPTNSLEKMEIENVVLKLQRFNNTVEKIIINKKII